MLRLLSYYGSKSQIAIKYPEPKWDVIIEPFAGGAGYSLAYPERKVLLIEKNPIVAAALSWIVSAGAEGVMGLPLLDPGQKVSDLGVCEEAKTVIGFWVNSAVAAPRNSLSKWGQASQGAIYFWGERCRSRLAMTADAISHWSVICGDYTVAPDIRATWFIDPPYEKMGAYYPCGSKDIDYNALGNWCRSRKGQVIVCENVGATWLPFLPCGFGVSAKRQRASKEEAMWYRINE